MTLIVKSKNQFKHNTTLSQKGPLSKERVKTIKITTTKRKQQQIK
jgi:hypothetical protein